MHVKLSTTLRQYVPGYDPEKGMEIENMPEGEITASDMAGRLGIPIKEIKFVMINGRCVGLDTLLQPDDRLAFFPAVGGG